MDTTLYNSKTKLNREVWLSERKAKEAAKSKYKLKLNNRQHLSWIDVGIEAFGVLLKTLGMYQQGIENAKKVSTKQFSLTFDNLPDSFNDFTVLHLSDLHIDTIEGFEEVLIEKLNSVDCDICFWTGDYRKYTSGAYEHVFPALKKIAKSINSKHGIYATLGNHDTYAMVPHLQDMGINLLINETIELQNNFGNILITGTDDPHYYPSEHHEKALQTKKGVFKIALIHSPEMYEEAEKNGYSLYLCGHTHAGQICLPNGYPPIKNLKKGHQFSRGLWQHNNMVGYTSPGCGVSGLPVRYNTQGEITVIHLKKKD